MCGIMGYVGKEDAVGLILEGLEKLEYRGYDSAGIAICEKDQIRLIKRKGRLAILQEAVSKEEIRGHVGIGHTRWATHGEPSHENSHPHLGANRRIAVVHNGIIENYKFLKNNLEKKGIVFVSETDSEVVAQLAEYYYQGDIMDTIMKVTNAIEGSYALGILCTDEPDTLYAVKKDNPLIIGVSQNGNFIASDVPAILSHTKEVYYMEEKQIAVLQKDSVSFYDYDKEPVLRELSTITWDVQSAEKSGYEHFMFKEIMEQPKVLRDTLASIVKNGKITFDNLPNINHYNKIVMTACGSAYNVGMVGKYILEALMGISVEVELASELRYRNPILDDKTLVILISQSGETADSIAAMRETKRKGAATLAIVNVIGSTIAKEADYTLYTLAGPEIAVATTKAFSAQLCMVYLLGLYYGEITGVINTEDVAEMLKELKQIPEKAEQILLQREQVQQYAASHFHSKSIFFIGRNIDYAIAMEGSLKLKEISYIHSEAYAGGELKHGTISLIEEETLVVAISCCKRLYGKLWSNVEQVITRGAKVLLVTDHKNFQTTEKVFTVPIPAVNELFAPLLSVILLQLFSYYIAANKGCDIDKPRNLAKSVTVE